MNKEDFIARYEEAKWKRHLAQCRKYREEHPEEIKAYKKKYREAHREAEKKYNAKYYKEHPGEVLAANQESCRKGGKYYKKFLEYQHTGLRGERNSVRDKHGFKWRAYKNIIAPESQIHHEWIPETADYKGVALVETDQHMHGIIDVIEILEGEIRLSTEAEIYSQGGSKW